MAENEWQWLTCQGRNGWDHPLACPADMGTEVLNVELVENGLGQKRRGSLVVTIGGDPFQAAVRMYRFVPGQDPTKAELWIVSSDNPAKILRVPDGNAVNQTLADPMVNNITTSFATHHGKLYIAYSSGVNRLHVYDPADGNNTVRRCGLATSAAPTVANYGTGSYPAVYRAYRVQWKVKHSGVTVRQSLLSPGVGIIPSGTGQGVQIQVGSMLPGEGENYFQIWGSPDAKAYYQVSPDIAVGAGAYNDESDPSTWTLNTAAPLEGTDTPFPSCKFLASDGVHLLGFGAWGPDDGQSVTPRPGRVYFTPAIGTSDTGDDERISNTLEMQGWIDARPNGGGIDRGMAGPMNDRIYVFQSNAIYMLAPTGDPTAPFSRIVLTQQYGAVNNRSIVMAEDEAGQPALYFLDPNDGPRRCGLGRTIDWLGKDVIDLWRKVDLDKASDLVHGFYDAPRKLVFWFLPVVGDTFPTTAIVFDVTKGRSSALGVRYGWSQWYGPLTFALSGVMFSKTLNAVRSNFMEPYIFSQDVPPNGYALLRLTESAPLSDGGVPYQS